MVLAADLADRLVEVAEDYRACAVAGAEQERLNEAWSDATIAASLLVVAETLRSLDEAEAA